MPETLHVGDELPKKISVIDLHPVIGEKKVVEVLVSYPSRPLICGGCHALGHVAGACPTTTRHWVRKDRSEAPAVAPKNDSPVQTETHPEPSILPENANSEDKGQQEHHIEPQKLDDAINEEEGWHKRWRRLGQ
ncbi:hypothetical protein POM88_045172 [Heracleum sosnowskyi]|uniref:Uncharacterized protein n=1 Tax=Heracleum sosnowskyi TaxID=360622 RepID=A0AAD8H5Z1_9APIA|nr:hypothetical protein POM88_045172 [Heracleum sosnowskyi]